MTRATIALNSRDRGPERFVCSTRLGRSLGLRPTREVLFTVVPREDRYKAKSLIDTFVYRLGDQLGAWGVAGLRALGAGASELALVAIPIALVWLGNALWLGRRQETRAQAQAAG